MGFISIDAISTGFDKAKKLLLPFSFVVWLKVAILSLFIGGGRGGRNGNMNFGNPSAEILQFISTYWSIILAVVIVAVLFGLLMVFVSSVFEFCFLESLAKKKVRVFAYFGNNLNKGISKLRT